MGVTQRLGTIPLAIQTDSSNNVGIGGAANASYKLAVTGASLFTGALTSTGQVEGTIINSTSNAFRLSGNNALSLVTLNSQSVVKINAAGFWGTQLVGANDQGILITNTGNVGIGTSSPSARLTVYGGEVKWGFTSDLGALSYTDNKPMLASVGATDFLFYTNATERMRITSGGRGLYGTTTPSAGAGNFGSTSFQVNNEVVSLGSLAGFFWENRSGGTTNNSNWYGWYTVSGTIYLYNGAANAASINPSTGAYTALNPSDIRIKDNVRNYNKGLNELLQINVKEWEYNGKAGTFTGEKGVGFIANELEQVIPEWVGEFETFLNAEDEEKTKLKNININELPYMMLKAIQELNAKVTALENK